jgi:hypothetical protein
MRRLCIALVALACILMLAPAGQAERVAGSPKKLWSEFPLERKAQQAAPAPRPAEPFLPPIATDPPEAGTQSDWIVWLAVAGAGAFVLLLAARPLATSRGHLGGGRRLRAVSARTRDLGARARDARPSLRMPTRPRRRAGPRRRQRRPVVTQYAPLSVVVEPAPPESVPYVTRRSGLVSARYVVLVDEGGGTSELRRSRAFWQIGRASWQRRMAENAWDALANDLRAEGWEVDMTGRFEYFVPLRRAIISTLEPYTRFGRKGAPGQ